VASNRTIAIELTGTNTKAIKAIEGVGAAATKVGATAESKLGGASSRIGSAFSKLDGQLAQFGVPFTGALGVIGTKLEGAEGKAKNFGGTLASVGQVAGVAAVGGLIAVGAESLKLADSFDQAHARLATATKNVGESLAREGDKIKGADEKLVNLGFTSTETEGALASLIPATHDVGAATGLMGLAADIARAKNISLGDATKILVAVEAGRLKGLAQFGIASKDATGHTISTTTALQKLTAATQGQAQAFTGTYAGSIDVVKAKGDDLAVSLGQVEKDALQHLANATLDGVHAFQTLNAATDGWIGKTAAIGAGGLVAFGAIAKVVDITKNAAQTFGLFSTAAQGVADSTSSAGGAASSFAQGFNTIATGADAAATAASAASTDLSTLSTAAGAAASAASAGATVQSTAAVRVAAAQVAETESAQRLVTATLAQAAAAQTLADVEFQLSGTEGVTAGALTEAAAAKTAAAGAAGELAAADSAAAAAAGELAAAESAAAAASATAAAEQLGTAGAVAGTAASAGIGAIAGAAVAVVATAAAIGYAVWQSDKLAASLEKTAGAIVTGGEAADAAKDKFKNLIGPTATTDLQHFSDLIATSASTSDVAAARAKLIADAYATVGANAKGGIVDIHANASEVRRVGLEANAAADGVAKLAKEQGSAAVQAASLAAAEKQYSDDVAASRKGDQGATGRLVADKTAVVNASKEQSSTQKTVNAAVDEGIGLAEKAATASATAAEKIKSAAKKQADAVKLAAKEQAAAVKAYQKDVDAFAAVAGADFAKVAQALRLPGAEIRNLTAQVKTVDAAFSSSFDAATNDISKFKDKTHVSFEQFAQDELKSIQATTNWSSNLVLLARQGLNLGFIGELAKAGVSSAGLVQSIEDNVSKGSINTVNSITGTAQAAKEQAKGAFAAAALAAAAYANQVSGIHPVVTVELDVPSVQVQVVRDAATGRSTAVRGVQTGVSKFLETGGPVHANEKVIVGEKGPELFVTPGKAGATVVGARGPELWAPPSSGDIIPNHTVKSLTARGQGAHATIKGYADGTAPFGSYGTFTPNPISVTFTSGSASAFTGGSLPSASTSIANFASTYLTDFTKVADTTKNAARATLLLADAHRKYDLAVRKVTASELKYRQDLFSGKPAAGDLLAIDAAYKARTAAHDLYASATQNRKTALGEQANAKAQLKRDSNPASFTQSQRTDTTSIRLFQSELSTLLRSGDPLLARELAGQGPDQGGPLAAAFVRNLRQARVAEGALSENASAQASYNQFLASSFRAAGGPVEANRAYVVGEKGPEVFVPKAAGSIVPSGQSFVPHSSSRSDTGGVINITIHSTVDAINGRAVYRVVKEDQRLHGAWDIKVNAP
jgi:hypothetical protein